MPTITMVNPRGTTQDVTELGPFEHYLRRGFAPQTGTVAAARTLLTGQPDTPAPLDSGGITAAQLTAGTATLVRGARLNPPPTRVISRFPSGHGWTGGADDTTVKLYTDRSYRGITNGAGANLTLSSPAFAAQDWTGSYLRLAVHIDDPTKLNNLQAFADSGTVGNAYIGTLATSGTAGNLVRPGDWTIFTIPRSAFSVPATPGWNNIVSVRVRAADRSTGPVTLRLGAVELLPDRAAVYPTGVLVIVADDAYTAHKTLLRPMLDTLGVPCTINPIAERITNGAAGITAADLRDMQDRSGWQVSGHAYTQTFHDTPSTPAVAAADFALNKKWLHDSGLHAGADDFALCPGTGSLPNAAMRDTLGIYWRSARMFAGAWETVVPSDLLSFHSLGFSGNSVATLQANIDQAAVAGGVFHFSMHDVLAGSTNGTSNGLQAIAVNNLQTVVSYALGKGMLPRTRDDWLAGR